MRAVSAYEQLAEVSSQEEDIRLPAQYGDCSSAVKQKKRVVLIGRQNAQPPKRECKTSVARYEYLDLGLG